MEHPVKPDARIKVKMSEYKEKKTCQILENKEIASGIFSMMVNAEDIAKNAMPGQFCSLYCADGARLLPRPISICDADKENGTVRFVYRVVGSGTKEFSALPRGYEIKINGNFYQKRFFRAGHTGYI